MNSGDKINILIVDDRPENLVSLEGTIEAPDLNIVKAGSGNQALGLLLDYEFALVLMDVQMPDLDGFEAAGLMRGNRRGRDIPIIFVTAISKEKRHVFRGYESGAIDYVFKPLDPYIIKSKVRLFTDLFRQKRDISLKNRELEQANKTILAQQRQLVEEERVKVLLQMAGATAHELNQPLMILLANIEMLELVKNDHGQVAELIPKIQKAGNRISDIIKKIQNIRSDTTVKHDRFTQMIDLGQRIRILSVEDSDVFYQLLVTRFKPMTGVEFARAATVAEALPAIEAHRPDLILMDYMLPDGTGLDVMTAMNSKQVDIPVIILTGEGDEVVASGFMKAGAYDYFTKEHIDENTLFQSIRASLKRFAMKMVLLPETGMKEAALVAEKIRGQCSNDPFDCEEKELWLTVSIGVASSASPGVTDGLSLIQSADKALYQAKHTGRDRVVLYGDPV